MANLPRVELNGMCIDAEWDIRSYPPEAQYFGQLDAGPYVWCGEFSPIHYVDCDTLTLGGPVKFAAVRSDGTFRGSVRITKVNTDYACSFSGSGPLTWQPNREASA